MNSKRRENVLRYRIGKTVLVVWRLTECRGRCRVGLTSPLLNFFPDFPKSLGSKWILQILWLWLFESRRSSWYHSFLKGPIGGRVMVPLCLHPGTPQLCERGILERREESWRVKSCYLLVTTQKVLVLNFFQFYSSESKDLLLSLANNWNVVARLEEALRNPPFLSTMCEWG